MSSPATTNSELDPMHNTNSFGEGIALSAAVAAAATAVRPAPAPLPDNGSLDFLKAANARLHALSKLADMVTETDFERPVSGNDSLTVSEDGQPVHLGHR